METERGQAPFIASKETQHDKVHNAKGELQQETQQYAQKLTAAGTDRGINFKTLAVMRCIKLASVLVTILLFIVCWELFYAVISGNFPAIPGDLVIWALYAVVVIGLGRTYHAYDVGMSRVSELVFSQFLANLISGGIIYLTMSISRSRLLNPLPLFGLIFAQTVWSAMWSMMANRIYFRIHRPQRTAIIYRRESDLRKLEQIKYFAGKFDVQKHIKDPGDIHQVIREAEGYAVVFVIGVNATLRNGIAKYCVENRVQGYIAPHVGDIIMAGAKHMQMFDVPIMKINRAAPPPEYLCAKRAIDIIASLAAILITSPLMLVTALAIKLNDGGPVLYKQVRLTKDRREFLIWKFRSMRVDAEKDGVARLAGERDDRITKVGRVIRAIRFDELPQLFNILGGSMAVVGPRPERPEIAAKYEKAVPAFALRLQVKAGLTGYAQIYGRYNTEPYDKLQMDLMYINSMSPVEDLRLMFATVKVLFRRESTQGVEKGQVTAVKEKQVQGRESA